MVYINKNIHPRIIGATFKPPAVQTWDLGCRAGGRGWTREDYRFAAAVCYEPHSGTANEWGKISHMSEMDHTIGSDTFPLPPTTFSIVGRLIRDLANEVKCEKILTES
jgi:hypothetical protein